MSKKETCERCGSEVQNDTAGGLCPRCLLALSFESQTMPEGERPDLQVSLSAEDMREHFPQFEILECLGRGGMGVVYKARQLALDREGRVKIADFGIATLLGASGEKSGTPPYMAPEQKQGVVDRRADIYALGAVLYEMLTGERPGQPIEPPSRKILIDVRLDEVVLRALENEPARRYQTAREFRTEVEGLHAPVPVDVPLQPRFSRTAIVGAVWASFFVFFVFLGFGHVVNVGVAGFIATLVKIQAFILLPLGLTAPFGTTILGCVALTQIRRSAGRLYGLGLALFDALVFPLLALDALIAGLWLLFGHVVESDIQVNIAVWLLPALLTAIIVDVLIVPWAWWAVRKPIGDQSPKGTSLTTSPSWQRRLKFGLIIGLIIGMLIVAGIDLVSQFPKIVARLPIVGSGLVEDTPERVDTTPEEPARQAVTANRLLATQIEARLSEAVKKNLHGNANNRGRREFVIFKSLAVKVSPDLRTATVHLTGLQPTETWPGGGLTRGVFQGGFDVNYAGGGAWEVTGTGGLAGRRFTVQTVDLMGIPPVDTTPEEVARDYLQASYGGDIERALGMIGGPLAETPKEAAKDDSVADLMVRKVQLPDADNGDKPKVLDLASGRLLDVPFEGEHEAIAYFEKLGQGDLAWDNALSTLRGTRVHEWKNGIWKLLESDRVSMGFAAYRLELPQRLLVTTAEGDRYAVEVSAGADDGVVIHYYRNDAGMPPGASGDEKKAQPGSPGVCPRRCHNKRMQPALTIARPLIRPVRSAI